MDGEMQPFYISRTVIKALRKNELNTALVLPEKTDPDEGPQGNPDNKIDIDKLDIQLAISANPIYAFIATSLHSRIIARNMTNREGIMKL